MAHKLLHSQRSCVFEASVFKRVIVKLDTAGQQDAAENNQTMRQERDVKLNAAKIKQEVRTVTKTHEWI